MAKKEVQDKEELAEVLEQAAETERIAQEKEEAKVWGRTVPASRSLVDFLLKLTKDEMQEIAEYLALTKTSSLKKQELAEFLEQPILEAARTLFGVLAKSQYEYFKHLVKSDGISTDITTARSSLPFFINQGYLFPGTVKKERVLALPKEIMELFQSLDLAALEEKAVRNQTWIYLAGGVLFYYGVLTLTQLADEMSKLIGEKIAEDELLKVLRYNAVHTAGTMREENDKVFANIRVFDYEKVQSEQTTRPDIWFYPLTLDKAMAAGAEDFVEKTPEYNKLTAFLQEKHNVLPEDAAVAAEECAFAFRMGESVLDVVDYLAGMLEVTGAKALQEMTECITAFSNTTRQWGLKGYAPHEVQKVQNNISNVIMPKPAAPIDNISLTKKIGRNDPCLCGSGKKYKKCCGKAL